MALGSADLTFERRETAPAARSVLARSACRLPLEVIRPFYLDESGAACVVLVSPGGGLPGGDRPFVFASSRSGEGLDAVVGWLRREVLFA